MKPPICAICGKDFRNDPATGELVAFADAESLREGEVGHPPGHAWLCSVHRRLATRLLHLSSPVAIQRIRRRSRMNTVALFVLSSLLAGVFAVAGSIVGGKFWNMTGLFAGGIVGGIAGTVTTILLASRFSVIPDAAVRPVLIGGIFGFIVSSVIAVAGSTTFNSPIVPVASAFLVGLGCILGRRYYRNQIATFDGR